MNLSKYLIKFLVLLSASLSLHSALALPLSAVLDTKYHAVSQNYAEQFTQFDWLCNCNHQQPSRLTVAKSLLLFLQAKHTKHLCFQALLAEIITLQRHQQQTATQSTVKHSYQKQLNKYLHILADKNSLYSQSNSYKAKLQRQKTA